METKLFDSELKVMGVLWREGECTAKHISERLGEVLIDLFAPETIVATPKLVVTSSCGTGGFRQIIVKKAVTGLDGLCILDFEIAGLVLCPNKAGELGSRYLRLKTVMSPSLTMMPVE